jgi:hypothetical protein
LAKEAIATARIVCDFDAGIATSPFSRDLLTISSMVELLAEMTKN